MSESFQHGMYAGEAALRARQTRFDHHSADEQASDSARNQDTVAATAKRRSWRGILTALKTSDPGR